MRGVGDGDGGLERGDGGENEAARAPLSCPTILPLAEGSR